MNFTFQDIFGTCMAFIIFPIVILFPGYVISWLLDLFNFKNRLLPTRYIIALIVSVAIVPILVYLLSLYTSFAITKLVLAILFAVYTVIIYFEYVKYRDGHKAQVIFSQYQKLVVILGLGWICFTILSLVDIQWGNRLYNNYVSLDFATRVTVINAITRTGIPPVNPSFYPGHADYITSLYYFWYILCSIVDQLGGQLVDARMALIAGDAWCGLALMAFIGLYLKIRTNFSGDKILKTTTLGIGLLTISGLDVIPSLSGMIAYRFIHGFMWPAGDIELWNEQITAWIGSLLWVPHHVAAMITCLTGFLLFQYYRQNAFYKNIPVAVITGLSFASAVGLSTWVTITFGVFLIVWMLILLLQKKENSLILFMLLAGSVSLITASPFLAGIVEGGTGASGFPVVLGVRGFFSVTPFLYQLSNLLKNIIYLLFLPVNYFMELGFFFLVGLLWLTHFRNKELTKNPYVIPEIILLSVVIIICSFFRSAIVANDLGWRGWLLGQFILLIWAVDLYDLYPLLPGNSSSFNISKNRYTDRTSRILRILMIVGFLTSFVDVALLRFWPIMIDTRIAGFPNGLSPDTQLGERTFASRLAYDFIKYELPPDVVIQPNPLIGIDRPSGLYGTRQIAVSANAPYNVKTSLLNETMDQISKIFIQNDVESWRNIDVLCQDHFINILVINDLDPLWNSLSVLEQQRNPLYKNKYYAIFGCGNFGSGTNPP